MSVLKQTFAVSAIGLRSLPQRRSTSLVIVIGIACVVAVLLSMLSVTAGTLRMFAAGGDPTRAIVHQKNLEGEWGSGIPRAAIGTILNAPGIAKDTRGKPIADAQMIMNLLPPEGFVQGSIGVRVFGPAGIAVNPNFRIVSGRLFRSGAQELVIGAGASRRFGYRVGDKVVMPDGQWPIVGMFTDQGSMLEGRLVGDADTVMSASRVNGFGSVVVQLVNADAYPAFEAWIEKNPALTVDVDRQDELYARQAGHSVELFRQSAYAIATIMALGALFGAVKIMYAAVRARTREIGTLRALGFGGAPVAASVLAEAVALSLAGAAIGAFVAWLVFDGREILSWGAFPLRVSLPLVGLGLAWGGAIALIGGLLPAVRAARLPAVVALRAS